MNRPELSLSYILNTELSECVGGGGFIQILVDGDGNVRDLMSAFSSLATGHIGYVDALAHLLLAGSRIVALLSHKDRSEQILAGRSSEGEISHFDTCAR